MAGFGLQIKGLDETIRLMKRAGQDIKAEVEAELKDGALAIELDASRNAPKYMGKMGQTISSKKAGRLQYEVVAPTRYAAYVEFGTKKKTNVPPGFEQYARQFQGKATGDFEDLLLAIAKWVKKKGIAGVAVKRFKSGKRKGLTGFAGRKAQERLDLDLAWVIAYSIAKNGINPQPFMYPALQKNRGKIIQELTRVVTKKR